jgi:hypothetical protein
MSARIARISVRALRIAELAMFDMRQEDFPPPDDLYTFNIVEHPPLPQGSGLFALSRWADPKYFGAMGIPVLRGCV